MATLSVKANTEYTGEVMDFVAAELMRHDFPADLRPDILIAAEEVFLNIALYAYEPAQEGDVSLYVSVNGKVVIRFEDSGQPFDPLKRDAPDLDTPVMERKIGGLGIHFARNLMDEVEYRYANGKNILTISKGVSKQDGNT